MSQDGEDKGGTHNLVRALAKFSEAAETVKRRWHKKEARGKVLDSASGGPKRARASCQRAGKASP